MIGALSVGSKMKLQPGDLVKLREDADEYELVVQETGITSDCVGLVLSYTKPGKTPDGKLIQYRDWYSVLFNGFEPFDFERSELEPL